MTLKLTPTIIEVIERWSNSLTHRWVSMRYRHTITFHEWHWRGLPFGRCQSQEFRFSLSASNIERMGADAAFRLVKDRIEEDYYAWLDGSGVYYRPRRRIDRKERPQ